MSSGGQYAGMTLHVNQNRRSICRNDRVISHTDKTRKIPILKPDIQLLIKIMGPKLNSQKQRGSVWPEWGVTLLRNGGSVSAGIYILSRSSGAGLYRGWDQSW